MGNANNGSSIPRMCPDTGCKSGFASWVFSLLIVEIDQCGYTGIDVHFRKYSDQNSNVEEIGNYGRYEIIINTIIDIHTYTYCTVWNHII
jgi:hypothetical protein